MGKLFCRRRFVDVVSSSFAMAYAGGRLAYNARRARAAAPTMTGAAVIMAAPPVVEVVVVVAAGAAVVATLVVVCVETADPLPEAAAPLSLAVLVVVEAVDAVSDPEPETEPE